MMMDMRHYFHLIMTMMTYVFDIFLVADRNLWKNLMKHSVQKDSLMNNYRLTMNFFVEF